MIATLLALIALIACTEKPADSGGNWDSFENETWAVTAITDNAGDPGMHPTALIDDCPSAGGACVTCFRMDAPSGLLTTWTSEGAESVLAYVPRGGLLSYRVTEISDDSADTGTATADLDGITAVDWFLHLDAGGYNRRVIDFVDATTTQDRMEVETGCPFMVPE